MGQVQLTPLNVCLSPSQNPPVGDPSHCAIKWYSLLCPPKHSKIRWPLSTSGTPPQALFAHSLLLNFDWTFQAHSHFRAFWLALSTSFPVTQVTYSGRSSLTTLPKLPPFNSVHYLILFITLITTWTYLVCLFPPLKFKLCEMPPV